MQLICSLFPPARTRWIGVLLIGIALGTGTWATPAWGQPEAFQKAKSAYDFGEYAKADSLFSEVAQDTSVDKSIRREALRYLGRVYIAREQTKKARTALKKLLRLEPPPVQFDPDREPPPMVDLYYEVRKQMQGNYAVKKGDPGLKTIAVMDFSNSSVTNTEKWAPLSKGFPATMSQTLGGATDLKVIERQRVQWLLNEIELQQKADVVDQSTAVRAGKLLGATTVLFGNYTVLNDRIQMTARLVEVETSELLLSEKIMGDPNKIFALMDKLGAKISEEINVDLETGEATGDAEPKTPDALLEYSNGLEARENGNWQAARKRFRQALKHDPDYKPAQQQLKALEVMFARKNTGGAEGSL
jgi:TolB-like protein